jgi:myo-inositol 2-dehydrogenase / D-chiro-inositol 1-dehydrogenase
MNTPGKGLNRRDFIGSVAAAGAVLVARPDAAAGAQRRSGAQMVTGQAPDGPLLTAGLIGCGGRGRGAAVNFLEAGPNLQVTALADIFPERIEQARKLLAQHGQDIPDSRCFSGFDAYEKLIASGIDVVLDATPPHFRPAHFEAAVDAGKHAFLEKPIAVDGPGSRRVIAAAEKADAKGLSVMTGTQLRRDTTRMAVRKRVLDGAIGDIRAVRAFRNQGALWYRTRQPEWSDMEYMIRDWVNWTWLSGDHIVEMHIHHLDQILWILGQTPERAVGMGARMRRATGDQYDFFSVDYAFDNGVHLHTTIRQISGCTNMREETIVGTRGSASLDGIIYDRSGQVVWKYDGPQNDALVQEHADWVTAIRTDKPINEARNTALSTLMAIMGRDSAYTGRALTWDDVMQSEIRLGPTQYTMGPVAIEASAPVPGQPPGPPIPV